MDHYGTDQAHMRSVQPPEQGKHRCHGILNFSCLSRTLVWERMEDQGVIAALSLQNV
jgi:hypothetical protein